MFEIIAFGVYKPYIAIDKHGNKEILVKCLNKQYGMIVASLLYYEGGILTGKSWSHETPRP